MDSRNLSKTPLEPDLIYDGEEVLFMSDREQKRVIVEGFAHLVEYLGGIYRGGAL